TRAPLRLLTKSSSRYPYLPPYEDIRSSASIAEWTQFETRSSRAVCHGSGTRLFDRYANDTPDSGSAQQYDDPTPPWPNVVGCASAPRPRMFGVVPRECGPIPRCIGMPMYWSTRSSVKLRVTYCTVRGESSRTP